MKRLLILLLIVPLFFLTAAAQAEPTSAWRDVFITIVTLVVAAAGGATITQLLKNTFKLEDRMALLATAVVAAVIAILELWLSGILSVDSFKADSFPATFFAVFSLATIYYKIFKGSDTFLGKRGLLKERRE